ncbi:hypothetical protein ABTX34_11150 [Streptomyces sp. NPDC096538]|uniref:hypothetical protein n=1 Tax=Streptomyces sp. NPDC096538 TaxID=3155427 RepID=UPI00332D5767
MTNIEAVLIGLLSTTHTREQAEHAARTVLRDHAHQLAEQIRENTRARLTRVTAVHGEDWGRTWASGRERAADLIDPEVQR